MLTDGLVELTQDDHELAAVIAHEVGHVAHRHPMRMSLQAAGVGLVMAGVFSDAMAITGLAAVLPTLLIENGYSREFEDAADEFALAKMREAVALEIATPKHAVTPGPTLPALEQLGDLLVLQHRPAEALAEYRRSLELYPRRLNSLLGAARAAKASGDRAASRRYYDQVLAVAGHATRPRLLDEARKNASRR